MSLNKVSTLTLNSGEDNILGHVLLDSANDFGYALCNTAPVKVVKFRISDNTRIGVLTLNTGEDNCRRGVIDTTNGFLYVGIDTSPAKVVKVKLSDFTRVGAVTFDTGEDRTLYCAIDVTNDNSYWCCYHATNAAKIVKVNNNGTGAPTRTALLTLAADEKDPRAPIIDGTNMYVGMFNTAPTSKIVKIDLTTFTRTSALTLNTNENRPAGAYIYNGKLYYCLQSTADPAADPSAIVKIDLGTFTRDGVLSLPSGDYIATSLTGDGVKMYAGINTSPAKVREVDIAAFTAGSLLTLTGDNNCQGLSEIIDHNFFVSCYSAPSKVVKLSTGRVNADMTINGVSTVTMSAPSPKQGSMDINGVSTVTMSAPSPKQGSMDINGVSTATMTASGGWVYKTGAMTVAGVSTATMDAKGIFGALMVVTGVATVTMDAGAIAAIHPYGVIGFPSGQTVQYRVEDSEYTLVQDWTSTGVAERAEITGWSTYIIDLRLDKGFKGRISWRIPSTTYYAVELLDLTGVSYPTLAEMKVGGIALESTAQALPTLTEIEGSSVLAKNNLIKLITALLLSK